MTHATRRRLFAAVLLVVLPAGLSAQSSWPTRGPLASGDCTILNGLSTPAPYAAGGTVGWPGAFAPGDFVTLNVTMNTATSSSVSIVGNNTGTPVLAGPLIGAGSINYTVTGPLPVGSIGIGFFVNSTTPATGVTVNVSMTCADVPVPVWPPIIGAVAVAAMLAIGFVTLRRRSARLA